MIAKYDEEVDMTRPFRYVDPKKPWKNRYFENCRAYELQVPVFINGKNVYEQKSLGDIKEFVKKQLSEEIWEEEQRFENPHTHYMDMTPDYYEMKMQLLEDSRK